MYNIIKNVIDGQRFELTDMLRKLDVVWLQGQITDEEKAELDALARQKADPQMSMDLYAMVADLEARVAKLEGGSGDAEYRPGNIYHTGDVVTYNGKRYRCIAPDGAACVWSPADYPAYWEVIA